MADGSATEPGGRHPGLVRAVLCFAGNLAIISVGLFALDVSLHILLFFCLIWTTAGVFYAATLGVPVWHYAPFAFFNYFNPLLSITMAALGIGLLRKASPADAGPVTRHGRLTP